MKEMFLSNSINLIKQYKNYNNDEIEKLKYGLEGLYLTITKLIFIIILSIILGILKEVIILLIFFNIIRFPAFGVHANKSSTCLILTTTLIIGLTLLLIFVKIPLIVKIILCILSFLNFVLYAPADTIKRPLTNAKKRKYRKIAACSISLVYIILIFTINNTIISTLIFEALLIESILINPITYKLMNMPYNNYKNCN